MRPAAPYPFPLRKQGPTVFGNVQWRRGGQEPWTPAFAGEAVNAANVLNRRCA